MKTTKILFWACALLFTLQACDLDRDPANYIDYEKSYRNMQDAKKWDNGIYSTLRGKFGGACHWLVFARADNRHKLPEAPS